MDGSIWSWGFNGNGQLGQGNTSQLNSPTQIGSDSDWTMLAAGSAYAMGIKTDGSLHGWGFNLYGSLGDGTNTQQNSPR